MTQKCLFLAQGSGPVRHDPFREGISKPLPIVTIDEQHTITEKFHIFETGETEQCCSSVTVAYTGEIFKTPINPKITAQALLV